jgi:hypothetical protein
MRLPIRAGLEKALSRRRLRRARRLDVRHAHDVLDLRRLGLVGAWAEGLGCEGIRLTLQNRADLALRVAIPLGTRFPAHGGHQDVVLRHAYRLELPPRDSVRAHLPFFGLEAFARSPRQGDAFGRPRRVEGPLHRFLVHAQKLPPAAVQAGIWALTDGCSRADLRRRLVCQDGSGRRQEAISHAAMDQAQALLDELGLDHRLAPTRVDQLDRIDELVRAGGHSGEAARWALELAAEDFGWRGPAHAHSVESRGLLVRILAWDRRVEDALAAGAVLARVLRGGWSAKHREGAHYLGGAALDLLGFQDRLPAPDAGVLEAAASWLQAAVDVLIAAGEGDGGAAEVYREGIRRARRRGDAPAPRRAGHPGF